MPKTETKKAVNVAGKERRSFQPYAKWTDPRSGWKYSLLKAWQVDNGKDRARWFTYVEGWSNEYGDGYVSEMLPGLEAASDLTFDLGIWATKEDFLTWARGSR